MNQTPNERIAVLETKVEGTESSIATISTDVKKITEYLHKIALNQSILLGGLVVLDAVCRYFIR